jgi:hypothetical protein
LRAWRTFPRQRLLAAEIAESPETALEQFKAIYEEIRETEKS